MTKQPTPMGPPVHLSNPYIMARIQRNCEECWSCGEPWSWMGKRYARSALLMNINHKMHSVRAIVHKIKTQWKTPWANHVVTTTCQNDLCMNPALAVQKPRKYIVQRTVDAGKIHTQAALVRAIASRRARETKVGNIEVARSIRDDDRPAKEIAAEFGMTHQNVYLIKSGRGWRDLESPLSGLGARQTGAGSAPAMMGAA